MDLDGCGWISNSAKDHIVDLVKLHQLIKIELSPQIEIGTGNLDELQNEVKQVYYSLIIMTHQL